MASLASLLNPSPESDASPPRKNSLPPLQPTISIESHHTLSPISARANHQQYLAYSASTTQEAAQALASLSESPAPPPAQWNASNPQEGGPLEQQRSWERRQSGYELPPLSTDMAPRKMSSPTLEQYHVASRSPEERRRSAVSPSLTNTTVAPVQGFVASAPSLSQLKNTVSDSAVTQDEIASSPAIIKEEAAHTPQPSFPTEPHRPVEVAPKVASLKTESSQRNLSPLRESLVALPSTEVMTAEQPTASKKRSAPAKSKKGTASAVRKDKIPPAKKRKVEPKRSTTPSSSRASRAPTVKGVGAKGTSRVSSPAPSTRSYSAEANEEDGDDEGEEMDSAREDDGDLYCICRKPDRGTFMIGCDGTCDDWYHGKCVGIEERNKNLIDKYICPDCTKEGIGRTTWKRMCRRSGCRQPAKVGKSKNGGSRSKYCSDECGVLYFHDMLDKTRGREEKTRNRTSRRKAGLDGSDEEPLADDDVGARGGALAAGEVKALLDVSQTAEEFRKLGDGVLSPPATPDGKNQTATALTDSEVQAIQRIQTEKQEARRRHAMLKDRMKFATMAKHAASRTATEKELKPKEYCGYDPRLEWTEERFQAWRNSKSGQQAFELETLDTEKIGNEENGGDNEGDEEEPVQICDRKKCARHLEWSKLAVDDLRFEIQDNSDRMRALEREETEIQERAAFRVKAGEMTGGTVEFHELDMTTAEPTVDPDKMDVDSAPVTNCVVETVEALPHC